MIHPTNKLERIKLGEEKKKRRTKGGVRRRKINQAREQEAENDFTHYRDSDFDRNDS